MVLRDVSVMFEPKWESEFCYLPRTAVGCCLEQLCTLSGMSPTEWKSSLVHCSVMLMLILALFHQTHCPDCCSPGSCVALWQMAPQDHSACLTLFRTPSALLMLEKKRSLYLKQRKRLARNHKHYITMRGHACSKHTVIHIDTNGVRQTLYLGSRTVAMQ